MKPPKRLFSNRQRNDDAEMLHRCVAFHVAMYSDKRIGKGTDRATVKTRIMAIAKEALEGVRSCVDETIIDGKPLEVVSSAGVFRLAFHKMGADRFDMRRQETLFAQIERIVDAELYGPNFDSTGE